jgi:hypothetical protein
MKRSLKLLLAAGLLGLLSAGCDLAGDDEDTSGIVTLSGTVLNEETNNPVPHAFVQVMPLGLRFEADSLGNYSFDVEIDSTMELVVSATKDGFSNAETDVLALAGRSIDVPTLRIAQTVEEDAVSGRASNLLLLRQSSQSIGVRESGSEEVAQITFQVADSLGRPIVLDKAVDVRFSFGVNPAGDAFLFPEIGRTDNNGQVTVNLSSGTTAGVVQIVAQTTVGGRTIRSLPVSVAIHGGLPDQRHFTLGPGRFNFPGLRSFGLKNNISVIVGDQYGNPVKVGTSVYFTTNYGVVGGSTLTGSDGSGGVDLTSANPVPPDGVAHIIATTADRNQLPVSATTAVVFSGVPVVTVSPAFARLGQTYDLYVMDQNGNPLVEGTSISVVVEGTKVKGVGHTGVRLDDTVFLGGLNYENILRGPGITQFRFRAVEDLTLDEDGSPKVEAIKITLTSENGSMEIVLGPEGTTAQVRALTPAVTPAVETLRDGLRARLMD